MKYQHVPVMLNEVMEYLDPKNGQSFVDCTLGGGGYTGEILKKVGGEGRVVAFDLDKLAIDNARRKINKKNLILINDNFKNLRSAIEKATNESAESKFDGIVYDLGLSSAQLDDRSRGFSFKVDAPLNMSFGEKDESLNDVYKIVNYYKEQELVNIIRKYGEEKYARRIARGIVEERKNLQIKTTKQLTDIIKNNVPKIYINNSKIHFATRTFQALRIETNKELESLELTLPQAVSILKPGGRVAVISYHSLEDRIVKQYFKRESIDCLCPPSLPECRCGHKKSIKIISKKIILPTPEEIKNNPRARSAKMRVAEKI